MREGDKRSTTEEVEKMRRLYKEGLSLLEIGRRMGRDHTTILYWIRKGGDYLPRRKIIKKSFNSSLVVSSLANLSREKQNIDICLRCKGPKNDPKWQKTNYCSSDCWDQAEGKGGIENW